MVSPSMIANTTPKMMMMNWLPKYLEPTEKESKYIVPYVPVSILRRIAQTRTTRDQPNSIVCELTSRKPLSFKNKVICTTDIMSAITAQEADMTGAQIVHAKTHIEDPRTSFKTREMTNMMTRNPTNTKAGAAMSRNSRT